MATASHCVTMRPARSGDRFLIRRWLGAPGAETLRGNRASAEAEIALAMESPSALCRVVESDGAPIGYAQAVDAALWDATLPVEIPPGCWDLDLFIAAAGASGKGVERQTVDLLAAEVFATTLAVACCTLVSIRNEAVVRDCERAGFKWIRIWQDAVAGPCWVLVKERPAAVNAPARKA